MVDLEENHTRTSVDDFTTKPEEARACEDVNRDYLAKRQGVPGNAQRAAEKSLAAQPKRCSRGEIDSEGTRDRISTRGRIGI